MTRVNIDEVKSAAAGRWESILIDVGGIDAALLDGRHHPCPHCGGTDRFRCLDISRGALFCNQCFNTQNGDGLAALQWLTQKPFPEVCRDVAEYLRLPDSSGRQQSYASGRSAQPKSMAAPKPKYVVPPAGEGFETPEAVSAAKYGSLGPVSRTWPYQDATGQVVGVVCRWDMPDGSKQIRPVALINGKWHAAGLPEPRPLYRLPEALGSTGRVWVVEGEKAADALASLGFTVTTSAHGSRSAAATDWGPLAGRDVVIWPDNDEPGTDYASDVRELLSKLDPCPTVRFIRPDGLPCGGDAADWLDQRDAIEPDALATELTALADAATPVVEPEPRFSIELIDSATFVATDYRARFLVRKILVDGQPCILGGAQKTLKTSIAVDLAFSMATGTQFLGAFDVPEPVPVGILSGESGGFTLKETALRIAQARGRLLSDAALFWGFQLPQLGLTEHLDALAEAVTKHGLRALVIDPAYLCMLTTDDGKPIDFANLFSVGSVLKKVGETFAAVACTPIVLHHESKNAQTFRRRGDNGPPELQDLSMAGFAEFARQWLLVGRREPYEHGSGLHRLWLNVGGSAGHGGFWAVDVDEGQLQDDFSGRYWLVQVDTATAVRDAKQEAKTARQDERSRERDERDREKLLEAYAKFPDGESANKLRSIAKMSGETFTRINQSLIEAGQVQAVRFVRPPNPNRQWDGFRLVQEGTVTPAAEEVDTLAIAELFPVSEAL